MEWTKEGVFSRRTLPLGTHSPLVSCPVTNYFPLHQCPQRPFLATAVRPAHTMFDGDTVFSLATGELDPAVLKQQAAWGNMAVNVNEIGGAAADALARAIVHAMLNAQTVGEVPCYKDKYPGAFKK